MILFYLICYYHNHNTGLTTGSDDSSLAWIHIGVPVILVAVLLVIVSVACLFVVIALKRCAVTHGQFKKGKLNNLIDCLIIIFYLIVAEQMELDSKEEMKDNF